MKNRKSDFVPDVEKWLSFITRPPTEKEIKGAIRRMFNAHLFQKRRKRKKPN